MFTNRKFKILIVEDDPELREVLVILFRNDGYSVRYACDGLEALQMVAEQHPDLIITDISMPGMDGIQLIRKLREDPMLRFTPIIIQTGAATSPQDAALGADAGALSYLTKPVNYDELTAKVRTLLEYKEYMDGLLDAAHRDVLTGLPNRRRFEQALQRESARFARSGRPFSLIIFDLDRFKRINDERGHAAGDVVLRSVGDLLQREVREVDTAARIGGEEFAIIVTETRNDGAVRFAQRLRDNLASEGMVTASFGVAEFPRNAGSSQSDLKALYRAADASMYRAKRKGGNDVCCADELADGESNGLP